MADDGTIVATIAKNTTEEVRVALATYKGVNLVDVRVFAAYDEGERRATKKGVALRVAKLPDLIRALQLAETAARQHGILVDESN